MKKIHPKWLNTYRVLHEDDIPHLERESALLEFGDKKIPQHHAEKIAYRNYREGKIKDSAAYHLMGMRIAHAVGDEKVAKMHGVAYANALYSIGLDPLEEPDSSIVHRIRNGNVDIHKFRSHPADVFHVPANDNDMKKSEQALDEAGISYLDLAGGRRSHKKAQDYSHLLPESLVKEGYSLVVMGDKDPTVTYNHTMGASSIPVGYIQKNEMAGYIPEEVFNLAKVALQHYEQDFDHTESKIKSLINLIGQVRSNS